MLGPLALVFAASGGQDFNFHDFYDAANGVEGQGHNPDPPYVDSIASTPPEKSLILGWLWDEAKKEWLL